jgi:hypothetical protein
VDAEQANARTDPACGLHVATTAWLVILPVGCLHRAQMLATL